jgi:hypothetical protein
MPGMALTYLMQCEALVVVFGMEADAMACETLVQPSVDCDEPLMQTVPQLLQYSIKSTL